MGLKSELPIWQQIGMEREGIEPSGVDGKPVPRATKHPPHMEHRSRRGNAGPGLTRSSEQPGRSCRSWRISSASLSKDTRKWRTRKAKTPKEVDGCVNLDHLSRIRRRWGEIGPLRCLGRKAPKEMRFCDGC